MTDPTTTAPDLRKLQLGIYLALAVAAAAAVYLLRAFMAQTYGNEAFDSVCNLGAALNCDRINTSDYGKLFGYPITVYALPYYAALAALTFLAGGDSGDERARARAALRLVQLGGALAILVGLFLIYVMVAIEGTICLFCLTMDAAAMVVTVLATRGLRRPGRAAGRSEWLRSAMIAVVVGGGLLVITSMWHDDTRGELVRQQVATARARFDKADQDAARAAKAGGEAGSTGSAGRSLPTARGEAAKIADNLFRIPVDPGDPTFGPPDAKVQVIEYGDFQCGYCKKLFYALKTVKDRYKDRVLFVFKHFPMNTLCNKHIKNNRHKYACNAALTAECARRQGRFWEMHDLLFKNQHRLRTRDRDYYAAKVGLDMARYKRCMRDPGAPRANLERTMKEAAEGLGITATPRTFVNGHMLSGAVTAEVLDQMIRDELRKAGADAPSDPIRARITAIEKPPAEPMVAIGEGPDRFFIDVYEASVDARGRAISVRGAQPANLNWEDARAACDKAGKKLCTSWQWVTACQGRPAVDDDGDGNFANDYVEGNQFPYADYFEDGLCHVGADSRTGRPRPTGTSPRCRTPTGIYDLAGNVEEWVELEKDRAFLAGGDFRAKEKAGCLRVNDSFGPGHRNHSTGFRCCADKLVLNATDRAVDASAPESLIGRPAPKMSGELAQGGTWGSTRLRGRVTLLTFFASWCSPCRLELPALEELYEKKQAGRGFQVVAVGIDTDKEKARLFAKEVSPSYPVVLDPDAELLGRFDVQNMPTSYLIDRKGVIRHKQVGFGKKTIEELEAVVTKMLE